MCSKNSHPYPEESDLDFDSERLYDTQPFKWTTLSVLIVSVTIVVFFTAPLAIVNWFFPDTSKTDIKP